MTAFCAEGQGRVAKLANQEEVIAKQRLGGFPSQRKRSCLPLANHNSFIVSISIRNSYWLRVAASYKEVTTSTRIKVLKIQY